MVKEYKVTRVDVLKKRLENARAIVLVDYKGINVESDNLLRTRLRKADVDYFVAKNTLIRIALNDLGITSLDGELHGPTAIAVSKKDEASPAREISKFVETEMDNKELLSYKAGLIGDQIFTPVQLKQLAALPSREELIARVLAGFNAPITGFVGVLQGVIRKFVYAVDAIAKSKAEQN